MNSDELKNLRNRIHNFSIDKQLEIFKMCKAKGMLFTENNNGIFINMTELSTIEVNEIDKYVKYIQEQEKELEFAEKEKEKINVILAQQE